MDGVDLPFRSRRYSRHACAVFCGLMLAAPVCSAANNSANTVNNSPWVATWGAAMFSANSASAADLTGQTFRQIVHTSVGGSQTRVWISNRFGREPLVVGAAHIALSADADAIQPDSDRPLMFHHRASITIPPGSVMVSDPVPLAVPPLSNLTVSMYFPNHTLATTEHSSNEQSAYTATGNLVSAASFSGKTWSQHIWRFLSGVDVYAPGDSAVVALGDSITNGLRSTRNANRRWPDFLAARLAANPATEKAGVLGVVNVGISGNRVLLDGAGPNAVSRMNWDVLARSNAHYLIVLEGINDIGAYQGSHQPYGDLQQRLEWALSQIAEQAHQHSMLVFGATLTPYGNCDCATPEGKAIRQGLNRWIRTTHVFDGVVDFAQATRDPAHPSQYLSKYDSGDHVHPNDAGYQAMANAIDLTLFTKRR